MTEHVDHEHQAIKAGMDAASAACATWRQRPSTETGEALAAALDRLNAVVQPTSRTRSKRSSRSPR
jgi:acyl-CoA reductase-like NAD-dependent aldehyde dehydrogenase